MGLGFLAAFGLATLLLLGVAVLIGWGVMIGVRAKRLDHRESWHDNAWLVIAMYLVAFAYLGAIVFFAAPPSMH